MCFNMCQPTGGCCSSMTHQRQYNISNGPLCKHLCVVVFIVYVSVMYLASVGLCLVCVCYMTQPFLVPNIVSTIMLFVNNRLNHPSKQTALSIFHCLLFFQERICYSKNIVLCVLMLLKSPWLVRSLSLTTVSSSLETCYV